jgi:hypothetical protein
MVNEMITDELTTTWEWVKWNFAKEIHKDIWIVEGL